MSKENFMIRHSLLDNGNEPGKRGSLFTLLGVLGGVDKK